MAAQLGQPGLQHVPPAGRRGQVAGHRGHGRLAAGRPPFGGHVPDRAHQHPAPAVRVVYRAQPIACPLVCRSGTRSRLVLPAGVLGYGVLGGPGGALPARPPRRATTSRELVEVRFRSVAQDVAERAVHLEHGAIRAGQEEPLVQGLESARTASGPPGAHPGQVDVGPHPGQQFLGRERLDEVVVRTRRQA